MTGSSSFPVEYAKVQSAYADLSSQPVKSLYRPDKKLTILIIIINLSWGTVVVHSQIYYEILVCSPSGPNFFKNHFLKIMQKQITV